MFKYCIRILIDFVLTFSNKIREMTVLTALLTLNLAFVVSLHASSTCQNPVYCPCGSTSKTITVCNETKSKKTELCEKWSRCKICQDGLNKCLQCEDGFQGPLCSIRVLCPDPGQVYNADRLNSNGSPSTDIQQFRIGQSVVYTCHEGFALQQRSLITCLPSGAWSNRPPYCTRITPPSPVITGSVGRRRDEERFYSLLSCPKLNTPRLGSIRCTATDERKVCVGKCLPGYKFENRESEDEITLTCQTGVWAPLNALPPCKSQGHCELVVRGAGSFNCTTRMENTRCDVKCGNRLANRYYCYPERGWEPSLPQCVRPKVVPDKATCTDPGFISNGFRRHTDGSESNSRRSFEVGESVVYGCVSDEYAVLGFSLLTCGNDGTWSNPLPKCIQTSGTNSNTVFCDNPGKIFNGRIKVISPEIEPTGFTGDEVNYPEGTQLFYDCDDGYLLQGSISLECQSTGFWSSAAPTCVGGRNSNAMFCANPGKIFNGRIAVISPEFESTEITEDEIDYHEGTQLKYDCDDGYLLQGSYSLECQSTGYWSSDAPTCVAECGRSFALNSLKVIFGQKTVVGEWPWVVGIAVQENNSTKIICGGALLDSHTVLTAAHCLVGASRFTLYFGKFYGQDRNDDTQVSVAQSTRVTIHPEFNKSTLDSDIALIKFEPRVRFSVTIQPICLPTSESTAKNIMTGRIGYVAGWRFTKEHLPANELLFSSLPVVSKTACLESHRRQNITLPITRNMFCAEHPNVERNACSGDDGSPLVFYDNVTRTYTVEGIVSFGIAGRCFITGTHTVFTKVFQFLPWIFRNMQ